MSESREERMTVASVMCAFTALPATLNAIKGMSAKEVELMARLAIDAVRECDAQQEQKKQEA